jgi:hypothetical protein
METSFMDEIQVAQERLGRALLRAQAGDDRALAGRVREEGDRFVKLLFGVLGMARLHALDNRAFDQPIADCGRSLAALLDLLGAVHLLSVEDQVYLNDIRIRLEGSPIGQEFGEKLRIRGVGGFSFHAPLTDPQLRLFVAALGRSEPGAEVSRAALQSALAQGGLDCIDVQGVHRFRLKDEEPVHGPQDGGRVPDRASGLLDEAFDNLGAQRLPNPLPLRRVVTEMLQAGAGERLLEVEGDQVSPYAAHTLRVCNLSLLLGRALGLGTAALQDLGVAAMFHDVGYASPPAGAPGVGVPTAFDLHPAAGARLLLRQRGFHEAKIRRLIAALDHHRRYDDSRGVPALFGRILAIAEDYDTLTQPRGGAVSPYRALGLMNGASGTIYDPVLMQLFVNSLGRYPPDTRLRLADGRVARVVSLVRSPESHERPIVRIERLADGGAPAGEVVVDLLAQPGLAIASVLAGAAPEPGVTPRPAEGAARPKAAPPPAPSGERTPEPRVASAEPPPAAHVGAISRAPLDQGGLPGILRDLLLARKTGVLHLYCAEEQVAAQVLRGNVVHAVSSVASQRLGELALREGLVRPEDLARAREVMAREGGRRLAPVLRQLGILDDKALGHLLTLHACSAIRRAFAWPAGEYAFEEQAGAPAWLSALGQKLLTPDLIFEAARAIPDPDVVRFHLGDLNRRLRLVTVPPLEVTAVSLTPAEGYLLSRVDGLITARELLSIVPGSPSDLSGALFGMLLLGLVEFAPPDKGSAR